MGNMLDNFRAWWNSVADSLGDPGKLAQLSVADLEKAIRKAKEAAAPVIGRPTVLESKLKELNQTDQELTKKILALLKSGDEGKEASVKYVERQVSLRQELKNIEADYVDAKEASDEWHEKIRFLENELYSRRNEANQLQSKYEMAKAEQELGKHMQSADTILGYDKFSTIKSRLEKEQAKAAGYSAMTGMDDKMNDEKLVKNAQTDALMAEYMEKLKEN